MSLWVYEVSSNEMVFFFVLEKSRLVIGSLIKINLDAKRTLRKFSKFRPMSNRCELMLQYCKMSKSFKSNWVKNAKVISLAWRFHRGARNYTCTIAKCVYCAADVFTSAQSRYWCSAIGATLTQQSNAPSIHSGSTVLLP